MKVMNRAVLLFFFALAGAAWARYLEPEPMLQDAQYVKAMAQTGYSVPVYGYALNNPLAFKDPTGREVELYCEPIWGHGVWGAARHCYIRTLVPFSSPTVGDGYDLTVEIWGPADEDDVRQVCDPTRGRPRELRNNPDRNSAFLVRQVPVFPSSSDDGSLENCIRQQFRFFAASLPAYNATGPNSNTFAGQILAACGITASFPWNAFGAPGVSLPRWP